MNTSHSPSSASPRLCVETFLPASEPPALRYSRRDSSDAHDLWRASCGPHALAAATERTLEEVRSMFFPPVQEKGFRGWTNPTMMKAALAGLQVPYRLVLGRMAPGAVLSIVRIQWEGPWLEPGRDPREAYRHTHWVAWFRSRVGPYHGWVLCTAACASEWQLEREWMAWLKARNSPWYATHHFVMREREGFTAKTPRRHGGGEA